MCSYADDTTFHACNSDLITRLEHDLLLVTEWFQVNYIELNEEYTSMNCYGQTTEGIKFGKVKNKKFLDLKETFWDWSIFLTFRWIYFHNAKKACRNPLLNLFGYCSLVWICYNRSCNNCINHLHERALWIAYNDNVSWFEDLLQRDQSVGIRHRNIRLLGIEL